MAVEKNKAQRNQEPVFDPENPPLDSEWFEHAQLTYPGWVTLKANLDRDVLEWYQSRWKNYRNPMNQIMKAYLDGKLKVVIPAKEYSSDRVKVVGKYDPEVVKWIKETPNSDGFMSLVLRDFMQSCIERGEPSPES